MTASNKMSLPRSRGTLPSPSPSRRGKSPQSQTQSPKVGSIDSIIIVVVKYNHIISVCFQDPNQDETFWNKFGTLGKNKKRAQEVKVVETEGKYAIDSPGMPKSSEVPPEVL